MKSRFPFLRFPLDWLDHLREVFPKESSSKLAPHLAKARYPIRLLRYWWAGQALAAEAKRAGRPLVVADLGCERGWLKHFTPADAVERWIGLDWNPRPEVRELAGYDEVRHANFDEPLPLPAAAVDAVVSLHVFEHLPRPGATMTEVARILKPGGIFLGGTPTMPDWIARMRERYFRKSLREGKIKAGGHITVLSPRRWRNLAADTGFAIEFATGSHLMRSTGSRLENHRWWIRLNQIWGGLFPSLGSEVYLQARREAEWVDATESLKHGAARPRAAWIALGAAAAVAFALLAVGGFRTLVGKDDARINTWLDAHQEGSDVFIVSDPDLRKMLESRTDVRVAASRDEVRSLVKAHPYAHYLTKLSRTSELESSELESSELDFWEIDSRLEIGAADYLLVRADGTDSSLREYLAGTKR